MILKLTELLPEVEEDTIFKALLVIAIESDDLNIDEWENVDYKELSETIKDKIDTEILPEYDWEDVLYENEKESILESIKWDLRYFPYFYYIDLNNLVVEIMEDFHPEDDHYIITFEDENYYVEKN